MSVKPVRNDYICTMAHCHCRARAVYSSPFAEYSTGLPHIYRSAPARQGTIQNGEQMNFSHITVERLISLIRYSLSGTEPACSLFDGMGLPAWSELFELAARQGVLAITYDAVKKFPAEKAPPWEIKIKWALSAEKIERRYARQKRAAAMLADSFCPCGVKIMMLKGLALSSYYPVPEHREFGDLDIYLFGDHGKGNALAEAHGIPVCYGHAKHSTFVFEGVSVENHASFTDNTNPGERAIEAALADYADDALPCENYFVPSREFNALFLLRHAARHFLTSGLVMRYLTDWGLFLQAEAPTLDMRAVMSVIRETGHEPFYNAMTQVAGDITGYDLSPLITAPVPGHHERILRRNLLADTVPAYYRGSRPRVFLLRLKNLIGSAPRYSMLPDRYWRERIGKAAGAVIRRRTPKPTRH